MFEKMSSELFESLELIEEEKGISRDVILDALENALISAYRKHYGAAQDVSVIFDEETGRVHKREEVIIASVADGSIAASNFAVGDILKSITIDGVKYEINRMFQITDRMYSVYENSTVIIEIVRDGAPLTLEISFAGRTPEKVA
jgi:hypothetical protein